jgi:hypothetical protein
MDAWSHSQVVAMLEGGTEQLQQFYIRHGMGQGTTAFHHRYQTKAARFYRQNMERHVQTICQLRAYMGRAASRKIVTASSTTLSSMQSKTNKRNTQFKSSTISTPATLMTKHRIVGISIRQQITVC